MTYFAPIHARRRVRPSMTFDATTGALPSGATFLRAGVGVRFNERGIMEELAADTPRLTYDPALAYNTAKNPWMDGPDTALNALAPLTAWSFRNYAGWTRQVVGVGFTAGGLPYVDIRFQAAAAPADLALSVCAEGTTAAAMTLGATQASADIGISLVGGTLVGAIVRLRAQSLTMAGGFLQNHQTGGLSVTATDTRFRATFGLHASVERTDLLLALTSAGDGQPVDMTLRLVFPVYNLGATYLADSVPLTVLSARNGGVPQYGLLGLLLEEATTNGVTNPRCEGAVVGSPGTFPTGWTNTGVSGLSWSVVSTGTEDGIPYVDIRWSGTAAATNQGSIRPAGLTSFAAVSGDVLSAATFVRLVGGSLAGLVFVRINNYEVTSGGAISAQDGASGLVFTPTSAPLRSQRYSKSRTFVDATAAFAAYGIELRVTTGAVVDVTLRIGAPQLEKYPYPTAPALPVVGTPAAAVRARDALTFDVAGIDFAKSTVAVRYALSRWGSPGVGAGNAFVFGAGDAGTSERVAVNNAGDGPSASMNAGGVNVATFGRGGGTAPRDTVTMGVCVAWGDGSAHASWDGAVAASDAAAPSPAPLAPTMRLNSPGGTATGQGAQSIIRYFRVWSGKKLSAASVQRESARTQ